MEEGEDEEEEAWRTIAGRFGAYACTYQSNLAEFHGIKEKEREREKASYTWLELREHALS